jgi:hypothetical protein
MPCAKQIFLLAILDLGAIGLASLSYTRKGRKVPQLRNRRLWNGIILLSKVVSFIRWDKGKCRNTSAVLDGIGFLTDVLNCA